MAGAVTGPHAVTVHRRTGRDAFGDPTGSTSTHQLRGCVFAPGGSTESNVRGQTVTTTAALYGPYDADVLATDVVDVDGDRFEVDGEPARWLDPFTREEIGMHATLRRVTG